MMKKVFRWIGIILGGLLVLLVLLVLALYGMGQARLNRKYQVVVQPIPLPADAASLAEGKRIFQYRGCEACHGEHLEGVVYLDNPAIGRVITPNLTAGKGGLGADRSTEDLIRSIRHGVRPDGTPLLFMPSYEFYYLSDADLGKILTYMRSLPPVDGVMPASELSFMGFVVMNLTQAVTFLPAELIAHDQAPPPAPAPGITPEYGAYLSISCHVCHGMNLSGGPVTGFPPEWPAAPNLTSGPGSRLPAWGETGFIEIIRTGEKHGRSLHTGYMPWTSYRHMSDDELRAVYAYLMSLPPLEFGNH
jgi:mono/diheme cytochrome c family protein